ncbi:MAG: hypothetical protein AB7G93_12740 [Bdellovibrionales bacterium]
MVFLRPNAVLAAIFLFCIPLRAEPWLSSRFAQNCASCHAPGRVNVAPKERRCTFSCQGCHTNPNGGGLRNSHGKWNQERWLRSLYVKDYRLNKPRPAPVKYQYYSEPRLQKLLEDKDKDKDKDKVLTKVAREGFPLRQTLVDLPESEWDRHSRQEMPVEPNPKMTLLRIPQDDPWRVRREGYLNAGADIRYFYLDYKRDQSRTKSFFPMAADIAASVEPFRRIHLVWEGRFLNGPQNKVWDDNYTREARVRSAYLLVNDLPYNTHAMFGIYRPLFGHHTPDHTSFLSYATGLDQRAAYKAVTVGTAPGVPFLNMHAFLPINKSDFNDADSKADKGLALNVGGRWVTFGAYAMLSYWNTEGEPDSGSTSVLKRSMWSLSGGGTYKFYSLSLDFSRVERETTGVRKDTGTVITAENRFRVWRETYAKFNYENMSTARSLREGKAGAYSIGAASFLISSLQLELMYKSIAETDTGQDINEKMMLAQFHIFF